MSWGFFSATQATQSAEKTGRKLGNQVIRKGYMSIHNLGIMKGGKLTNEANEYITSTSCVYLKTNDFFLFIQACGTG